MGKFNKTVVSDLHNRYIKGTVKGAVVQNVVAYVCPLTLAVRKGTGLSVAKVYVSTRVLKHNYDKKPAQEYDFLVANLFKIIRFPDHIYHNQDSKRGDFCFIKTLENTKWLCSLGLIDGIKDELEKARIETVTFFCLKKENYLNNYKLLWNWEGGTPPS